MKGKLYLLPNTLGDSELNHVLPAENLIIIGKLKYYIVEELKNARRFLSQAGWKGRMEELQFFELNEHSKTGDFENYLEMIFQGHDMGLLSDAGLPCVADPGAQIVELAQSKGIAVVPLVGPSSIFLSLMASGFNGQNFAFLGYLPRERKEREMALKDLEKRIYQQNQTQIFIETPYRNIQMFESILHTCSSQSKLCVASNITLPDESIITKTIADWKKLAQSPEIHKRNTVFLLYK